MYPLLIRHLNNMSMKQVDRRQMYTSVINKVL